MSHVMKVLLRPIMQRVRQKIEHKIGEKQYGFVEFKGITHDMYLQRNIIERSLKVNKDIHLCFIDYIMPFVKSETCHNKNVYRSLN